MSFDEVPLAFRCAGETLVSILARPERPVDTGVVIVVGGPQYRAGSHRQFVHLSRHLAAGGVACLRFDYRGMGDSTGGMRTFEDVSDDIAAAVDALLSSVPTVKRVALWGLCDGASAACFYSRTDHRVAGVALVNPWVRTEAGEATAFLRHYYWRRLLERAFWVKVFRGEFRSVEALGGFFRNLRAASAPAVGGVTEAAPSASSTTGRLPERMAHALAKFDGRVLLVLSGNDLVASEFSDLAGSSAAWRRALAPDRTARCELPAANHTFASEAWRAQVAQITLDWVLAFPHRTAAQSRG